LVINFLWAKNTHCTGFTITLIHTTLGRMRLKCDDTRTETRFRLSAKRTSPFKLAGASVQSTTGSRGGRISGSNAGYTMFRGSEKGTGYPLHSPVSPSIPFPCVTVCHHISTGLYDSSGIVISPTKRPLPDNTQHSQVIDTYAGGGIRTRIPSNRAAEEPRLKEARAVLNIS
jgi:hypothetical protein